MQSCFTNHFTVDLSLGSESVNPPDLGEHCPIGEGEAQREAPRPQATHHRKLLLAHKLAIKSEQEDGAQTQHNANQCDVVASRMGQLDEPGRVNR